MFCEWAGSSGGNVQYLLRPPPQLAPPEDVRLDVRRRRRKRRRNRLVKTLVLSRGTFRGPEPEPEPGMCFIII